MNNLKLLNCIRCGSENVYDKPLHQKLRDTKMVPTRRGMISWQRSISLNLPVCKNCYEGFHKVQNRGNIVIALFILGILLIIPGIIFMFSKNPIFLLFFIPLPTSILLTIIYRNSEFSPGDYFSFKYREFRVKPLNTPDWILFEDWIKSVLHEKYNIEFPGIKDTKVEEKEDCPKCNLARKINQLKCPWCGKKL